jgi:multidrug resistance efflux pump
MKLKTKKSHFQTLPEGKAPRRILPVVLKTLYYLLLLGIIGGIGYVVGLRYLYFSGRGQVEIEKVSISSHHGGRIETIARQAGDSISPGETLAVIDTGIECPEKEPDLRLVRLAYDIRLKQAERDIHLKRLESLDKEQNVDILPRALEIGDAFKRRQYRAIGDEIDRLKQKANLLEAEIATKREELAALERASTVETDVFCGAETIRSAISGSVYHVIHRPGEYVKKGAPLFVVIPHNADVLVEAFFDRKHLSYISAGQQMTIEFPDRSTSTGEIVDYMSSASYFAERYQKDYLPVEAQLRVNLKPVDGNAKRRWKRYDRMDVKVMGER